jgi:hypothetical protein
MFLVVQIHSIFNGPGQVSVEIHWKCYEPCSGLKMLTFWNGGSTE